MASAGLTQGTTLNTGATMPWLGLGVWQVAGEAETERVVRSAIELGYRSIDTAKAYGNEVGVGKGVRNSGVPRDRLFVTTKVWNDDIRADRVEAAFDQSLRDLGLDYVDLYLVHWPIRGRIVAAWKAMERIFASGRAKAIGVSNHIEEHLDELLAAARVVPAVNQIEFHPWLQSPSLVDRCRQRGIAVEAWSPLMRGGELLADPVLVRIARAHGRTPAQVVLRWNIERGVVTIPKSANPQRQAENAAIFDFTLEDSDLAAIARLDRQHRSGADPLTFGF
jgi:diketogulonate reductase-like aldo/keto reductase